MTASSALLPSGSRSVMASRREPPDSLDFFPSPPWATRTLVHDALPRALAPSGGHICSAWDPAAGEGHMAEVLREEIPFVRATDIFDYGRGYPVADFLDADTKCIPPVDLIVTNPPFNAAVDFTLKALDHANVAVAILARTTWLEGDARYRKLFEPYPITLYCPFIERVAMIKGRWEPAASTATAYAWYIWVIAADPIGLYQIPPGRKRAHTKATDFTRFAVPQDSPLLATAIGPAAEG